MKKLLLVSAAALSCALSANATMVLVDFGQAWTSSTTPGAPATNAPAGYNYFAQTTAGDVNNVAGALTDTSGGASPYTISATLTNGSPINPQNGLGAGLAFAGGTYSNAMQAWSSATGTSQADTQIISNYGLIGKNGVSVTLSGLTVGTTYSIYLLCGNSNDGTSNSLNSAIAFQGLSLSQGYTVSAVNRLGPLSEGTPTITDPLYSKVEDLGNNKLILTGYAGGDNANPLAFTELTFTAADSSLAVTFSGAITKGAIQAIGIQAIPEPSTYALAGGALALGVALVVRRRKRG